VAQGGGGTAGGTGWEKREMHAGKKSRGEFSVGVDWRGNGARRERF
jgi:hypothetical protein